MKQTRALGDAGLVKDPMQSIKAWVSRLVAQDRPSMSSMDLPVAHSYESILGSEVDEYELNDISQANHVQSQDEGDYEGLLRDENNRKAFPSV
jgi:hypothetical protein